MREGRRALFDCWSMAYQDERQSGCDWLMSELNGLSLIS